IDHEDAEVRHQANDVAVLLADSARLGNLRRIELYVPIHPLGFNRLASAKLDRLESFTLRTAHLDSGCVEALGRGAWFRNLRELRFDGYSRDDTERGINAEAVAAIGALPEMPNLTSLTLEWANPTPEAVAALARSKSFPRLGKLVMR